MSVWAIVAAGGRGDRLGADRPKAFVKLGERVLLAESLERLDASDWIDGIVVAAPPGWEEPAILLAEELGAGKVAGVVTGGETRTASVAAALADIPEDAELVLVHDAARPLVSSNVVERLVRALGEGWDGAVPGLPVPDTLKRVDGSGQVLETVPRADLVAVQTPQAFVASVLRSAYAGAAEETDCAALVEARGGRVTIVPGDPKLLKVTTLDDLALVESWL